MSHLAFLGAFPPIQCVEQKSRLTARAAMPSGTTTAGTLDYTSTALSLGIFLPRLFLDTLAANTLHASAEDTLFFALISHMYVSLVLREPRARPRFGCSYVSSCLSTYASCTPALWLQMCLILSAGGKLFFA